MCSDPPIEAHYHGYTLKFLKTHIEVWRNGIPYGGKFNSGWAATCYIDELLSP